MLLWCLKDDIRTFFVDITNVFIISSTSVNIFPMHRCRIAVASLMTGMHQVAFNEMETHIICRAVARDGRVGGVAINFADRRAWFWVWLLLSFLRRKSCDNIDFLKVADNTLILSKFADKLNAWGVLHPHTPL